MASVSNIGVGKSSKRINKSILIDIIIKRDLAIIERELETTVRTSEALDKINTFVKTQYPEGKTTPILRHNFLFNLSYLLGKQKYEELTRKFQY